MDKAVELLKKYSPESYFIVSTYNALLTEFVIDNLATQHHGVFGLLEEFNTYYWSTKCAFDLLAYYEDEAGYDVGLWQLSFNEVYSTLYSFQEFKYFNTAWR
jgi:hypothetical protein